MPAPARVKAVAFDLFETVFPLEPLRPHIVALGLAPPTLEGWFAAAQRGMAALAAAGDFKPFAQVLDQTLVEVLAQQKLQASPEQRGEVMAKLKEPTPPRDAAECVDILRAAGIAPFALTNGSVEVASAMLGNAKLKLSTIVSVDDVGIGKPHRRVHEHGAKAISAEPGELALIVAHGWDINGAKAAGLVTLSRGQALPADAPAGLRGASPERPRAPARWALTILLS